MPYENNGIVCLLLYAKKNLVYCHDQILRMNLSTRMKTRHNENTYASVPAAHSVVYGSCSKRIDKVLSTANELVP